jgi:hypothetical protein
MASIRKGGANHLHQIRAPAAPLARVFAPASSLAKIALWTIVPGFGLPPGTKSWAKGLTSVSFAAIIPCVLLPFKLISSEVPSCRLKAF